ncbi:ATPase domain-containing protein, partial [Desulfonatronospira sp.]|uniref:ATPase domain-containing protein n=1 Tax=Desulfonatronospira sp. TaxID=1962951 RepID=UPI0025B9A39B
MMKSRTMHVCTSCGSSSMRWQGQCPGCGEWNTLEARTTSLDKKMPGHAPASRPSRLSRVDISRADHISTGMGELDDVLGGGLVPGGVVLLGGEPGIGKSTLLLQLLSLAGSRDGHTLYISGEESMPQIRSRAQRLALDQEKLQAMATGSLEDILAALSSHGPYQLVIIDSVQTISSSESDSMPGAPTQIRLVSSSLIKAAKESGTCIFLVGHVTKEGQIAGPKLLEHMVDTVIYLEGDKE